MFEIDNTLMNILESKISSSNSEYQNIMNKIARHRENMLEFSKFRSEILSEFLIKRRTI